MPKRDILPSENETVIGAGVHVKGNLASEGDISVDGHLVGDIKSTGSVTLGINSVIRANVTARNVKVAGQLTGSIKTEGEASITETGKVVGDISCGTLHVTSGAVFVGQCNMTETEVRELPEEQPEL
jgi:cytoskeletal protein CcmA (bactofilin family)